MPDQQERSSKYRNLPPLVEQIGAWTCWAAALESWLHVTPGRKRWKQEELIDMYGRAPDGRLDPKADFPIVSGDLGLTYKVWVAKKLRFSYLYEKLRDHGHVFLCFNYQKDAAHCNAVYGVGWPGW